MDKEKLEGWRVEERGELIIKIESKIIIMGGGWGWNKVR